MTGAPESPAIEHDRAERNVPAVGLRMVWRPPGVWNNAACWHIIPAFNHAEETNMLKSGVSMFFTDYSMAPGALGIALEKRGFESVWAPEHSHIPLSRKSPFPSGGELPKRYYDAMDPFVTLTAAAAATKTLRVGTGVCLVAQRDPIQTAKLVASIDQVSGGRFLFGIGTAGTRTSWKTTA